MEKVFKQKKGITLIALVITIIVLLILAGISISMLSGDNSILQKVTDAKQTTERSEAKEQARIDVMSWITDKTANHESSELDDSKVKDILTGKSYVKTAGNTSFTTVKGEYEIPYSELYDATQNQVGEATIGQKYEDSWIGKLITYTADNGESNWIILGKDTNGDVLITTINPLGSYTSKWGEEYVEEYDTDLQNACGEYTGKIGVNNIAVKAARSITGTDIDRVYEISEDNEQIIYADGSNYWCAGVIIGGPTYAARFVGQTIYGGRSISHTQALYKPGQYQGSTTKTCKLRPVVVLSAETPWEDVKNLIGTYVTY